MLLIYAIFVALRLITPRAAAATSPPLIDLPPHTDLPDACWLPLLLMPRFFATIFRLIRVYFTLYAYA